MSDSTPGRLLLEATCETYGGDPDECPPDQLPDYEKTAQAMTAAMLTDSESRIEAAAHALYDAGNRTADARLARTGGTPTPHTPWNRLDKDSMEGYAEWCIAERFLQLLDEQTDPEWAVDDCAGRFTLKPTRNGRTAILDCELDDIESNAVSTATVFLTHGQLLALADTAQRIARTLDAKEPE